MRGDPLVELETNCVLVRAWGFRPAEHSFYMQAGIFLVTQVVQRCRHHAVGHHPVDRVG